MIHEVDILIVIPPVYKNGRVQDYNIKEPLGVQYIKSFLINKKIKTEIIISDLLSLNLDKLIEEILKYKFKILGFSLVQRNLPSFKLIIKKLKKLSKKNYYICCGGIGATLNYRFIFSEVKEVDYIILHEGEIPLYLLYQAINKKIPINKVPNLVYKKNNKLVINKISFFDIDLFRFPSRDYSHIYLEKTNYLSILSSRGCFNSCTFCSNSAFESLISKKYRFRNLNNVIKEIKFLKNKYNLKMIKFNDPEFIAYGEFGKNRFINFCKKIIKNNLNEIKFMAFTQLNTINEDVLIWCKKSGFERILVGIESFDNYTLKKFNKRLTFDKIKYLLNLIYKYKIQIVPGFLIFNPYTTLKTLKKDLYYLKKFNLKPNLFKCLRVFNNTKIMELLEQEKRLIVVNPFNGYHKYLIDYKIATIYNICKLIWIEFIDKLNKIYQKKIWDFKKSDSFKKRYKFYKLQDLIFNFQFNILIYLIKIINNKEVSLNQINDLYNKIINLHQNILKYIDKESNFYSKINSNYIINKIYYYLKFKPFNYFIEKYSYND